MAYRNAAKVKLEPAAGSKALLGCQYCLASNTPIKNCIAVRSRLKCIRDALPPCMLAQTHSCLVFAVFFATLASVAAFYPATGALNTQPLVLCDSLDADVAALLTANTPAFPGALAESRCVAINVCDEQNHRGEAVPIATWLHRSEKALELDGEAQAVAAAAAAGEHYNYHSLEYARVPEGVVLQVCEPNFDHLRVHGEYVCAGASVTSPSCADGHHATATCSEVSPALYECASCALHPGQRVLPWSAADPGACVYEDCPPGTFEEGGACTPCAQHTYTASAAQTACVPCESGTFTAAAGATVCETCFADAYSGPEPACASGRGVVRSLAEIAAYFNASAAAHAGAFDLYAACVANVACLPCAPGSREAAGACEPCAVGTYQPNFQQTTCFACGTGLTTHSEGRALASECVCVEGFE